MILRVSYRDKSSKEKELKGFGKSDNFGSLKEKKRYQVHTKIMPA
jgi:hypothetical protein